MTFVVCRQNRVVVYYSLAVGAVDHVVVPARIKKGLARHLIPIIGLFKDAVLRTLQAAKLDGIRAIFVNAKDENVRRFYERFDFEP